MPLDEIGLVVRWFQLEAVGFSFSRVDGAGDWAQDMRDGLAVGKQSGASLLQKFFAPDAGPPVRTVSRSMQEAVPLSKHRVASGQMLLRHVPKLRLEFHRSQ